MLSGLSGGGKTAAAKLFEDLAYTVVDNLPGELLPNLAELVVQDPERFARVAIVLDVRAGDAETAYRAMRGALEGRDIRPQVFFLEASDETLIRRFSETRHRHPLANGRSTAAAITLERRLLDPIRAEADVVVDTTDLPLRDLRERLFARLGDIQPDQMTIQLISFGYKFGIPLEADLVFDTRFIQNPYYVPELREHSGLTEQVRTFVLAQPGRRGIPRPDRAAPRVQHPGLRGGGQEPPDHRHRLHRRPPPLDRGRRGARPAAAREGPRAGRGAPSRARAGVRRPAV